MDKYYSDPRGALGSTRGMRTNAMTRSQELLEKAYTPIQDFGTVLAEKRCIRLKKMDSKTQDFLSQMRHKLAELD
jgi:hypothetical protein